jgi:serine/threonine protein kinase
VSIPYPNKTSQRVTINIENACFKAPEIRIGMDQSVLSDIYLIGAAIFYMFSGFNNFEEKLENSISLLDLRENNQPDKHIMDIIKKCTAVEPDERFQCVDDIIASINNHFGKDYSIIEKRYIQAMPQYRIKPLARYSLIDKVLNNAKGHFFIGRPNKASLIISPEGSGKSNFLENLSIKAEHEGFIPVQAILNESDLLGFSVSEIFIKSITKYVDKELIDKYVGDINSVISQISKYRSVQPNTEVSYSREDSREKAIQKLNNFITEASKKFHFIFIIDNFQWIDEDSLELINEILKSQNNSKTYFIFALDKDAYSQSSGIKEYCRKLKEMSILDTITLNNFGLEDTAEFIRLI